MKRLQNKGRHIKYENMLVFARFKYAVDRPAFRVHIWDLFEECSLATTSFEAQFDEIYERLYDEYEDQGFDKFEARELSGSDDNVSSEDVAQDQASEDLIEAVDAIYVNGSNLFAEETQVSLSKDGKSVDD